MSRYPCLLERLYTEWPTVPRDHTEFWIPSAEAKAGSQPIRSLELKRTVRVDPSLLHRFFYISLCYTTVCLVTSEDANLILRSTLPPSDAVWKQRKIF